MALTRVSVLMPVARVDAFVAPAIQSVLNQRDVEVELILIGPATQDDPEHTVEQHIQQRFGEDSRLRFQAREAPGIVNALNLARQQASCHYIARMDADDVSDDARLKHQLQLSQALGNSCLIGACVSIFSDAHEVLSGNRQYESWLNQHTRAADIKHACLIESLLPHPTWFAHKSVWDTIGEYRQGDFPEDYDFILRAWLLDIPMAKPDNTLLKWREHPQRLTRTDSRYRREAFTRLKAETVMNPRSQLAVNEGRRVWIAGTGRNARYWHDALSALGAQVAGFVDLDTPNAKQRKRHKPVIRYPDFARDRGDDLLITAITAPAARRALNTWCVDNGLKVGVDVMFGG